MDHDTDLKLAHENLRARNREDFLTAALAYDAKGMKSVLEVGYLTAEDIAKCGVDFLQSSIQGSKTTSSQSSTESEPFERQLSDIINFAAKQHQSFSVLAVSSFIRNAANRKKHEESTMIGLQPAGMK